MEKVLMISLYYPPLIGGTPLRSFKYSNALAKHFEVDVLTLSNPKDVGIGLDYSIKPGKNVRMNRTYSLELGPLASISGNKKGGGDSPRKLMYWFTPDRHIGWFPSAALWTMVYLLKNRSKVKFVYTAYPAPTDLFVGFLAKLLFRAKWVIDMHDSWDRVVRNYLPTPLHKALYSFMQGTLYRSCDMITIVTTKVQREIMEDHRIPADKFWLLPQTIDFEDINAIKPVRRSDKRFVITYTGNVSPDQDVLSLILAINKLIDSKRIKKGDFVVKLALPGQQRGMDLLKGSDKHGVIESLGQLGYEDSIRAMKGSDLLYLGLANKEELKYAHPSKIYEYVAAGKAIIASVPEGEASKFINGNKVGIAITNGRIGDLSSAVYKLYKDKKLREMFEEQERKVAKKYDTKVVVDAFLKEKGLIA